MAKAVATVQTSDRMLSQTQDNIVPILNKLQQNPFLQGVLLKSVALKAGSTVIPHGLGRVLQGWGVVRQRALAQIYDTQDSNQTPDKNLNLTSSAAVTVDLYVF